jgi:hypothetical protein
MSADTTQRLKDIVERLCGGHPPIAILGQDLRQLDVSKPNIHDSKEEFLQEKRAVDSWLSAAAGMIAALFERPGAGLEGDVLARLRAIVDERIRAKFSQTSYSTVAGFLRKSTAEDGFTRVLLFLIVDLTVELDQRKQELMNQEAAFWSTKKGRPPNPYPRVIALRLARIVARSTRMRPTIGVSADGGHPSTPFGRALQEVFEILGIKANVRHTATWAIAQLNDADVGSADATLGDILSGAFRDV